MEKEKPSLKADARSSARVMGKDDLIGWQGHSGDVCEDHEGPGWTVLDDGSFGTFSGSR